MDLLEKQIKYRVLKYRLTLLINYLKSDNFQVESKTYSTQCINDHLYIYNYLRRKFMKTWGDGEADVMEPYQELYLEAVHKLYPLLHDGYKIKTNLMTFYSIYS